jgi:flavodoxin I
VETHNIGVTGFKNIRRILMKVLVVYDSVHGNTEKIARSMGAAIGGKVNVSRVSEVKSSEFESLDLLIVGSPTYGGRPTPGMLEFLKTISGSSVKGVKMAAFDTRVPAKIVKIFGFAAGKIENDLKSRGALTLGSQGFFVKGKEGPLVDGELERAASWAKELVRNK